MEVPSSPHGPKRKQASSSTQCDEGFPPNKRSNSMGSLGDAAYQSDFTDLSESDFSLPKIGDSPPPQIQPDEPESPSFYGLPMDMKDMLKVYRKIDGLYEWQSRLMDRLLATHRNMIYCVPTSGGKTLVAELMLIRELLVNKQNALLVLPYVSIVQEKLRSLYPFAQKLNFMIEEFAGSRGHLPLRMRRKMKTLYVATIEKANLVVTALLEQDKFDTLGLVVIDELHMIGDGSTRGATLESLIIKCKLAAFKYNPVFRMIGMSATLSNFKDLETFMNAELVKDEFRPVELKENVKIEHNLFDVTCKRMSLEDMPLVRRFAGNRDDGDDLVTLVGEVIPDKSCLVFCSSKKHCETVALFLTSAFRKTRSLRGHRTKEKRKAVIAIQDSNDGNICPTLLKTIPSGIAYHHSGLTPDEREVIESSFLHGVISCIVCTSTLAAGVNLPAERVIIREPYVGREFLSKSQYQQMCGRAGRAGMTESGLSILFVPPKDREKVKTLIESPVPSCTGSLLKLPNTLSGLLLNLLHMRLVASIEELKQVIQRNSFSALQCKPTDVEVIVNDVIKELSDRKFMKIQDDGIEVTPNGRGIIKSLIGVDKCEDVEKELTNSSKDLNVESYLHLIFITTVLFEESEFPLEIDCWILFDSFMELEPNERKIIEKINVHPSAISRARDSGICDLKLKRLFVTLLVYDAFKNRLDLDKLSRKFGLQRGIVHSLLNQVANHASSLFRFVEEKKDKMWAFAELLPGMCEQLTYCCNPELVPLMQLPGVKVPRAKQLLKAGYKDVLSIAKAKDKELVSKIENMSTTQARRIIKAARHVTMGQREELLEQVQSIAMNDSGANLDVSISNADCPLTP